MTCELIPGVTPYYHDDGIALYHGDCRELLPLIPEGVVDLVLTDPPYGIGEARNERAGSQRGDAAATSRDYGASTWDDLPPDKATMMNVISTGRWAIVFGGNYFELPRSACWLVWDKDTGSNGYADAELAWTNLLGAVRLKKYRWMGMLQEYAGRDKELRVHPTQKPTAVVVWAIKRAPEDCQTILDPFAGSGTTLVAAKQLNRRAIGIEIEERYCEIAANRLAQKVFDFQEQRE